jgi:competence protein ComEC
MVFLALLMSFFAKDGRLAWYFGEDILPSRQNTPSYSQPTEQIDQESADGDLSIHYLDVGQGDATLVISGTHAMLIDVGDDSKGTQIQNYLQKQGITQLDYLILTHPHADHIGGAPVVITKFDVDQILMTDHEQESSVTEKVFDALTYRSYRWATPKLNETYPLGNATFRFLGPIDDYEDVNNSSLCVMVEYGKTRFLFTGDCEEMAEEDLVANRVDLEATVYQVGHHGSNSSSQPEFLTAVSPMYAVISCGIDNSYQHPHEEVLERLAEREIAVFRTDVQGTIVATCDLNTISWNASPIGN